MEAIDWNEIKDRYKLLRFDLEPFGLPSESELADYKSRVAQCLPLKNGLALALDWGYRTYPGSSRRVNCLQEFNEDLQRAGVSKRLRASSARNDTTVHVPTSPGPRTCFEVIDEALATQTASTEFLMAWGSLWALVGRQHELLEQEEDAADIFRRNIASGNAQGTWLQERWYALWVYKNTNGDETKRTDAEYDLAELCREIWQGERHPASGPPKRWYRKMIRDENGADVPESGQTGPVDLKTPYHRIRWPRLVDLAQSAKELPGVPPTDRSAFPKAKIDRP